MLLSTRIVTPEILDTLDAGHPDAVRSRQDLRRLDVLLGGTRWITRSVAEHRQDAAQGILELGAGEGRLCECLAARLPGCPVTGLDFVVRPPGLTPRVQWRSGDFFQDVQGLAGGVLVGSLILHHFENATLRLLGEMLDRFRVLIFSEPFRHSIPLGLSRLADPFVGKVTRHDMPVSIRAGFREGELAGLLGLDKSLWMVSEDCRIRGVLRFKAWRR